MKETGEDKAEKRSIAAAARWVLMQAMSVLSVEFFMSITLTLLHEDDPGVSSFPLKSLPIVLHFYSDLLWSARTAFHPGTCHELPSPEGCISYNGASRYACR